VFVYAGATDLVRTDLRDRGADDTRERRPSTARVHARNAALLVRMRAERNERGPMRDAMIGLDAITDRPNPFDVRLLMSVDGDAAELAGCNAGLPCE
jgi:hypothetical protein